MKVTFGYSRLLFALLVALVLSALLISEKTAARPKPFQISPYQTHPWLDVVANEKTGRYEKVDPPVGTGMEYFFYVRGQCPEDGYRLKSASITLGPTTRELEVNHEHRSIGADHGLKWESYGVYMKYNDPDLTYYFTWEALSPYKPQANTPAEGCNCELEKFMKTGGTRASWLERGITFKVHQAYKAKLSVWCEDSHKVGYGPDRFYSDEAFVDITLRCRKSEYQPPRTKVEPQRTKVPDPPIESIEVAADPLISRGRQCPLYVNFRGRIAADENSDYSILNTKYRFVGDSGYQTDWIPVALKRNEPRSIHGRRFIQTPQKDAGGTFTTPGVKPKIPIFNGWMMVEVMLPNGHVKRSEKTEFTVDCNPQDTKRTP